MKPLLNVLLASVAFFVSTASGLTLKETVRHTLDTNPEMFAALNKYKSRIHEVRQARAAYLPDVSLDIGVGRETRKSPSTESEEVELTRRELGLSASQLIFDGFAASSEVKRQKARRDSARFEMNAESERLALRTAQVYLDVLRHAALLDLARATLWEHQNIYDQMKLRYDTGVGSKADFDQIQARLALANANMIVAQNNYADTQSAFHRLTGSHPTLESLSRPKITTAMPPNKASALSNAVDQHPVIMAANADMSAADQQYKAAKSAYFPKITLEADKRWDENIGGLEGDDEDLIVALRLRYDLFKGGANKARRQQTAFLIEESKDIRNNARRQVIESLNLSWNAFEAITAQIQFLNTHVAAAVATKEAYKKQFNIGRRTLLDLLNTENEVTESKRSLINAEYDQLYSQYRIFNSMGTLVESL